MIKYFPKNKIIINLYTKGNEFTVNGKQYVGAYYKTFNGKVYTGKNPAEGSSKELTPISLTSLENLPTNTRNEGGIVLNDSTKQYLINPNIKNLKTYQIPPHYYPKPTDSDYTKGYIMRYFAKKRNDNGYVIEISKDIYLSLQSNTSEYDYITYQATDLFWQLTGPLRDTRVNKQYKTSGIIDTNKRLVEAKDKSFRGLIEYIGEKYEKYSKPTP
jgi:hypothetical protein